MNDQTTDHAEPDDLSERIISRLDRLIDGVESGSAAVAAETAAREAALAEERTRTRRLIAVVCLVGLLLVVGLGSAGYDRLTRNETTCTEKRERAEVADQRVTLAVDRLARTDYVGMPPSEREAMTEGLASDLEKLPPPC